MKVVQRSVSYGKILRKERKYNKLLRLSSINISISLREFISRMKVNLRKLNKISERSLMSFAKENGSKVQHLSSTA